MRQSPLLFTIIAILIFGVVGVTRCAPKPLLTTSPITSPASTERFLSSPLLKPIQDDGEFILFISFRDRSPNIYAISPDGAKEYPVLALPSSVRVTGQLDWTAANKNKRLIAFSLVQGVRSDVFVADLATSNLYNITGQTPSGGIEPRWSPDGTRLVYVCGDYEPDICIIGIDGGGYAQLTSHPSRDINPSWSPDGLAIAYQTSRSGLSDIYLLELENLKERNLTQGKSQNAQPSWSPDGKLILFQSDRDGSMDIFVISTDGTYIGNLTSSKALDVDPKWSPDGELIAFRSNRDGSWDLFVMKRDGRELRNLTYGRGPVFTYAWSPDSRYIAFASGYGGNSDIFKVDIKSGEIIQLTKHPAEDMAPLWIFQRD